MLVPFPDLLSALLREAALHHDHSAIVIIGQNLIDFQCTVCCFIHSLTIMLDSI